MKRNKRVELACHTGYSIGDGIGLAEDWIDFALENGIKTLVITDNGCVDSYVEFWDMINLKNADIKLIMGADLNIYDDRRIEGKIVTEGRLSVLIRNAEGKKNLYRILSEGDKYYKYRNEIKIPLSLLLNNRDGLLIGSGSKNGLLLNATELISERQCVESECLEFNEGVYDFLDYVELPIDEYSDNMLDILLNLANNKKIPAVVVSSPHFIRQAEVDAYRLLKCSEDNDFYYYHLDDELLSGYDYLGEDIAYELVVTNSQLIADMCEMVNPLPNEKLYPLIENANEILRELCENAFREKYPKASKAIRNRFEWELEAIRKTDSAFMFLQIKSVLMDATNNQYEVMSRGSVASSMVAYLCGITEIDPVKAKLSPYFFYGYYGEKTPDIDLNFRADKIFEIRKAFEKAPGVGKVLTTRAIHPGKLILLPSGVDTADICPLRTVYTENGVVEATCFDYHGMDEVIFKFDALSHNSPVILAKLHELTGISPEAISLEDREVIKMFQIDGDDFPACVGIPEFTSEYVLNALKLISPQKFDDLVKLCGLMHGTDVWENNAELLISEGYATIGEVIADRNDIYDTLIEHDFDEETAYRIADEVRKGRIVKGKCKQWSELKQMMQQKGLPDWFIFSCEKIKYMFPRAHSYSYMVTSWRIAWYKQHFPLQYYKVMLEIMYKDSFDDVFMANGAERFKNFCDFLKSDYSVTDMKTMDAREVCMLLSDYYSRGFELIVSHEIKPGCDTFTIEDPSTISVNLNVAL